ncbi:BrnT family toxin [Caulobacter sp. 602-1]|uniref:BrnT family toxin n=1 Tax=Caulobacter sp. 602-1 TaxID=2492472 RepID=UPI000F638CB9|nr:BrnT family toxin [Caulobacter sp. 602-1]RRN64935.1 BrnT family toxin [Caulobacter sp. 602-1]
MEIEFDDEKRQRTLEYRDLDFADAASLFEGITFTILDDRRDYGEERFQTIGLLGGGLVMVVWTPRGGARRIISMRKCNAREQSKFGELLDRSG